MGVHCLKNKKLFIITIVVFLFLVVNILNASSVNIQNEIIELSKQIRDNEIAFDNLAQYKQSLEIKKNYNNNKLLLYKNNISEAIVSLYKLTSIPFENLLLSKKSYEDIAIAYALLNYYSSYIQMQMNEIYEHLYIIQQNSNELTKIEKQILDLNNSINANLKSLKAMLDNNKNSEQDVKDIINKNKIFISKSDDLFNLMIYLNKKYVLPSWIEEDKLFIKNKGNFVLPVIGYLDSDFHKDKSQSIYYNGITILANPSSQIVAPFDGEILFVDNFINYDNLIIIKHSALYFSIISGKFESFVKPTQLVKSHEAIAISSAKLLPIYFEIQHNNVPMDPNLWINKKEKTKVIR
jgi:murein DD-endopeptidase MepM/ murein hydrolase activator NlpD